MKTLLSWSTGKDSAWSLHLLKQDPKIDLAGLFTTVNEEAGRVAMHATRRQVAGAQAAATGLELYEIPIPNPCPNEVYEARLAAFVEEAKGDGVEAMAFGDLYLEDIRAYRETNLAGTGIEPLFPIWGKETHALAREMIAGGLKAKLVSVDPNQIPPGFAGRDFDEGLIADLPEGADPCGENGEFHTCVYGGPMFAYELALEAGETIERDGFVFADFNLAGA